MGLKKTEKLVKEYLYDFAYDGGAVGNIALKCVDPTGDLLEEGLIVQDVMIVNEGALTSTGSPTITVGTVTDPDGFFVDVVAKVTNLGTVVRAGEVDGALVWDSTADAKRGYPVPSTANDKTLRMVIGTAPLSGGKLRIIVEGIKPGSLAHPSAV